MARLPISFRPGRLLFLLLFFAPLSCGQPGPYEQLYQEHFFPYPLVFRTGTPDPADRETYKQVLDLYSHQDFSRAIPLLEKLAVEEPENLKLKLMLGVCYLDQKRYQDAFPLFKTISDTRNTNFTDYCYWYSGLAHTRMGEPEKAREFLHLVEIYLHSDLKDVALALRADLDSLAQVTDQ